MTASAESQRPDEDALWRQFLGLSRDWLVVMERALGRSVGVSVADLELLEPLLGEGDAGLRAKDLATAARWQDSRVSHQLRRMERRGLVVRIRHRDDARGTMVLLTDQGRHAAHAALDTRREVVRQLLWDNLDPAELALLVDAAGKIRQSAVRLTAQRPR